MSQSMSLHVEAANLLRYAKINKYTQRKTIIPAVFMSTIYQMTYAATIVIAVATSLQMYAQLELPAVLCILRIMAMIAHTILTLENHLDEVLR